MMRKGIILMLSALLLTGCHFDKLDAGASRQSGKEKIGQTPNVEATRDAFLERFDQPDFLAKAFKASYDRKSHALTLVLKYEISRPLYQFLKDRAYYFSFTYPEKVKRIMGAEATALIAGEKVGGHRLTYTVTVREPVKRPLSPSEANILNSENKDYDLNIADSEKNVFHIFKDVATYVQFDKDTSPSVDVSDHEKEKRTK
ncbi:hypothetical protein [Caenibacillus caldisaponilyticus]|uniref:hypothetical protein n=1 Tax=Caenibacillus caldisaponilyticus TaxID=1674942 RepID=UPI001177B79A|nr:hypothetical protein [Caenibacillus caldisaponilyticus]